MERIAVTPRARLVLLDCEAQLEELRLCPAPGAEEQWLGSNWRRRWVAALALLRSVGHVLKNADGVADANVRAAAGRAFGALKTSKPNPAIYWSFIEQERNNVLKEYRFPPALVGSGHFSPGAQRVTIGIPGARAPYVVTPGEATSAMAVLMRDGPFAGRYAVDVVSEAIEWWRAHLDAVDAAAKGGPACAPSSD